MCAVISAEVRIGCSRVRQLFYIRRDSKPTRMLPGEEKMQICGHERGSKAILSCAHGASANER
jgi:hypothetical protein